MGKLAPPCPTGFATGLEAGWRQVPKPEPPSASLQQLHLRNQAVDAMEVMQHTGARCGPLQCPVLPTRTHLRLTTSRRCAALRKHIRVRAAEEGIHRATDALACAVFYLANANKARHPCVNNFVGCCFPCRSICPVSDRDKLKLNRPELRTCLIVVRFGCVL